MKSTMIRAAILAIMPGTNAELAERTGLSVATVHRHTKALHRAGQVHLAPYRIVIAAFPTKPIEVWAAGPGEDAPRPVPATRTEITRRYRAKCRAEGRPDRPSRRGMDRTFEHDLALQRARDAANTAIRSERPATWLDALFGKAA